MVTNDTYPNIGRNLTTEKIHALTRGLDPAHSDIVHMEHNGIEIEFLTKNVGDMFVVTAMVKSIVHMKRMASVVGSIIISQPHSTVELARKSIAIVTKQETLHWAQLAGLGEMSNCQVVTHYVGAVLHENGTSSVVAKRHPTRHYKASKH